MDRFTYENLMDTSMLKGKFNCKGGGGSVPKPSMPPPPAPPVNPIKETSKDQQQSEIDTRDQERRRKGYQASLLNDATGLATGTANTQAKTLLGG